MRGRLPQAGWEGVVALAARLANVGFNAVTILVLAAAVSSVEQGYYFTFLSLVALVALADAGLTTVLMQFLAHERRDVVALRHDHLDVPAHALSRMRALVRFSILWYAVLGALLCILLWAGGYALMSGGPSSGVDWKTPWVVAAIAAALDLTTLPLMAVLMGLGFVRTAYVIRLAKVCANAVVLWVGLALGFGLYAVGPGILAGTLAVFAVSIFRFRGLIVRLLQPDDASSLNWRQELFPMMWRLAISWMAGYFIFAIMTPIAFRLGSPVLAGQIGASVGIIQAVMMVGHAVVESQMPRMGLLASQGRRREAEGLARKTGTIAIALATAASVGGMFALVAASWLGMTFVDRLLPLADLALFLAAAVIHVGLAAIGNYLRVYRREPFLVVSLITGAAMAPATVLGCLIGGGTGMGVAFIVVTVMIAVPTTIVTLRKFNQNLEVSQC